MLNTANGKFYPAFNRDNERSELDLSGGRIPELQINNLGPGFNIPLVLPLFRYAAASAPLRQRVYREIYRFIERIAAGDGRPAGGAGRPEAGCRRPFVGGSPFVGEARPVGAAPCGADSPPSPDLVAGTVASSNIESLRTYLEASAPEFSARVTPERLTVSIRPNSMSALRVQRLTIGGDHGQDPVRVDVTEGIGPRENLVVEAHPAAVREDGTVDLGGALVDARFFTGVDLLEAAPPLRVNIRWIAGLEDAHRQRLEQRFGLLEGKLESTRTWHYWLSDTSPARLAEILGNDAVEDTHGFDRGDFSLADQDRDLRRRLTRAPHLYELVFTFSRPLPRLEVESIALTFVNTVTGQEVVARRAATIEAADGEASPRQAPSPAAQIPSRTGRRRMHGWPFAVRDHARSRWRGASTTSRAIWSFQVATTWSSRAARNCDSVPASSC